MTLETVCRGTNVNYVTLTKFATAWTRIDSLETYRHKLFLPCCFPLCGTGPGTRHPAMCLSMCHQAGGRGRAAARESHGTRTHQSPKQEHRQKVSVWSWSSFSAVRFSSSLRILSLKK